MGKRVLPIVVVSMSALGVCGCSGSSSVNSAGASSPKSGHHLVAAPSVLLRKCRATARAVGYPVPCPTFIPAGLAFGSLTTPAWRGWVVGSSYAGAQHLVFTASPRPLKNSARLVNGPAWYPRARVRSLGPVVVDGRRMHAIYVPPATNDGSAFMHHVVLVWTKGGHTYGFGFHDTRGIEHTLVLDEQLARHVELVRP